MTKRIIGLPVFVFALLAIGCAESEDPTQIPIEAHPATWVEPGNEDFHGEYVRNSLSVERTGTEGCAACHGVDLGQAEGDQCYDCHAAGSSGTTTFDTEPPAWTIHPPVGVWLAPQNANFHARALVELGGSQECSVCHGVEYAGGWSEIPCTLCHAYADDDGFPAFGPNENEPLGDNGLWNPHPMGGWYVSSSPDFHGRQVELRGPQDCEACHYDPTFVPGEPQDDVSWAGTVNCANCHEGGASGHPAPQDWIAGGGHAVAALATTPVGADCMRCHGTDLTTGGTAGIRCNQCHTWPLAN